MNSAINDILAQHFSLSRLKQMNVRPRHQGVLLKLSDWLKEWRPRFFAIYGTRLFICSDPNPADSEEPKVEIDFSHPSPNLSLVVASTYDKSKGSSVLELKMSKIKDRPKGLNLRSAHSEDSEARDDLNSWLEAILEVSKQAMKDQPAEPNSPTTGSNSSSPRANSTEGRSLSSDLHRALSFTTWRKAS
jgi:hypothetical protein